MWTAIYSVSLFIVVAVIGLVVAAARYNRWVLPDTDDPANVAPHDARSALVAAERWTNRYQTLIAGIVALLAAAATVGSVNDQLTEMRRQTAAAALGVLQQRAEYFRQVKVDFDSAGPMAVAQIEVFVQRFPHFDWEFDQLVNYRRPLENLRALMSAPVGALAGSNELQALRANIASIVTGIEPDMNAVWAMMPRFTPSGPVFPEGKNPAAEISRIKASMQTLKVEFDKLSALLEKASAEANRRLADAEAQAFP